jgi:hypothetical protein
VKRVKESKQEKEARKAKEAAKLKEYLTLDAEVLQLVPFHITLRMFEH